MIAPEDRVYLGLGPASTLTTLHPLNVATGDRLANAINRWGIRKGILHSPFTEAEVRKHFSRNGYCVQESFRRGNGLFLIAQKSTDRACN